MKAIRVPSTGSVPVHTLRFASLPPNRSGMSPVLCPCSNTLIYCNCPPQSAHF